MTGVTIGCFLVSYLIVWAFELSRLWFRLAWRPALLIVLTTVSVLTHGMFLLDRAREYHSLVGYWGIPATVFAWSQLAAFGLAASYLAMIIRRPNSIFGIFLLPIVVIILLMAILLRSDQPFERATEVTGIWSYLHGGGLSAALVSVSFGLVVSILRLWQERRLKSKKGIGGPIRLPSLEYLDSTGRTCLITSTVCIAIGLIGGIIMNSISARSVDWSEPGILVSLVLLVWMVIALIIETRLSKTGASYATILNIISFCSTIAAITIVLTNSHGRLDEAQPVQQADQVSVQEAGSQ